MKIWKSFLSGIKLAALRRHLKMALVLWGFNFILGLVFYFLAADFFSRALGNSALAEGLQRKMDFNVIFELVAHHAEGLRTLREAALLLMALFFLVSVFLNGGILHIFTAAGREPGFMGERGRLAPDFFQGAGKYFGRFCRLCLYSLLLWVTFIFLFLIISEILGSLYTGGTNERLMVLIFIIEAAIALFFWFFIKMILDYTQIKIVLEDSRFVFRSFLQMIAWVLSHLGKTLGLYYLLLLLGLAWMLGEWGWEAVIPMSSPALMIIFFLVGQIFIAGRCWLRMAVLAGQLDLYSSR